MRLFPRSLYGKILAVYLLLFLSMGIVLTFVVNNTYTQLLQETDQKLNTTLAANLAEEFSPYLQDSLQYDGVANTMRYLMVMNPRVEIYLLDEAGNVLAFFADQEKIKQKAVRLEPIQRFLDSDLERPVMGDDPRSVGRTKPFSVAPIQIPGGEAGYLYVILEGEKYDSARDMVDNSHIVRATLTGVALILGLTWLVGLVLFFFLTKRFRRMTDAVRQFEQGDYAHRIAIKADDEIGHLGNAFNQMADTIEANMEELKRTDDLRRELIANVSHDLRSPLASIQGYVETILMKDVTLTNKDRARFLHIILDNTTMLNRLVNELFELSKLDALQVQPQTEPFSMAELTQDVVMKFQPQAEQHEINLKATLPQQLPMACADIGMIERVLSNLLENALRFTPRTGHVRVDLQPKQQGIHISVEDTGPGIPAEDLPFVCERFYRVEKSRDRAAGGSGLGLAIAHRILDLHGSRLNIESTFGEGTTVSFDLPTVCVEG